MSLVVAVKQNDTIYMGADSQASTDYLKENSIADLHKKIVRMDNGFLIGFVGYVKVMQQVLELKELFAPDENGELTRSHLVNKIIDPIYCYLKDSGAINDWEMDGQFLIGYKDALYRVYRNFKIVRVEDSVSIGSGMRFGDEFVKNEELSIEERILGGLRHASNHIESVSGPFLLIDTKNLEYKVVEE